LPDAGAEEIYGCCAHVVIAGQFGRPLQAASAQGGYRITGRAPFVSNCDDANWIAMEATVMAGDHSRAADKGEPAVVMAYLPRDRCHVIDTWHVMGMRGTGSHDVAAPDIPLRAGVHPRGPTIRAPSTGSPSSALPRPISLRSYSRWRGARLRRCPRWRKAKCPWRRAPCYGNGPRRKPSWHRRRQSSARVASCSTIP
jgi:hypothetical protein